MIQRLLVKNYAIIEELEIEFSEKLTIITGETGAGKSILLGALGLIMGNRADSKVLFNQKEKCIIEGHFKVANYKVKPFFDEHDIDYDEEVIIRRELTPAGKSRAFINDTPVNLSLLKQLSSALIDLHQQFDTMDIHQVSFQLRMIDALADNQERLENYQMRFRRYQEMKKRLAFLEEKKASASQEQDYLKFQLEELKEVKLLPNEQDILELEQKTLSNAEEIKQQLTKVNQLLREADFSALNQLQEVSLTLGRLKDFNHRIEENYQRLDNLVFELTDISSELQQIEESTEPDEERISIVNERLNTIYKLQTKHRVSTVAELLAVQADLEAKVTDFGDQSAELLQLEAKIKKYEQELKKLGEVLSKKRKAQVGGFEKKVHKLLALLSMEHAMLKVDISRTKELTSTGFDQVEFLFAPNRGSRFESIKSVASGGELSRLTLCTKSLVADAIPLPTLIYDEIDAGVSGDVALKMGHILSDLSSRHQVISITHTPQIAAKAHKHYFVYKTLKGNRTFTSIKPLTESERVVEIATMLSGSPPTAAAKENAVELLQI